MRRHLVLAFSLAALLGNLAWAGLAREDSTERPWNSANVLKQIGTAPDKGIPEALVAPAVPRAFARSQEEVDERCQRRIGHAEHDLHEAIEHHGRYSRQADHERRELRDAREQCWREHHRWWNEHEHRWHDERDWDDHDHDRN